MRKLKVLLLKDNVDAVVRSLGEAGIVQFVDMETRSEDWKEILVPHAVSPEKAVCQDAVVKISVWTHCCSNRCGEPDYRYSRFRTSE